MTLVLGRMGGFGAMVAQSAFPWPPNTVWQAMLYVILFGIIGILLTVFGFKVFDWVLPKVDVEVELAEKQNLAVAIVVAAVILGVSGIIIAAMIG